MCWLLRNISLSGCVNGFTEIWQTTGSPLAFSRMGLTCRYNASLIQNTSEMPTFTVGKAGHVLIQHIPTRGLCTSHPTFWWDRIGIKQTHNAARGFLMLRSQWGRWSWSPWPGSATLLSILSCHFSPHIHNAICSPCLAVEGCSEPSLQARAHIQWQLGEMVTSFWEHTAIHGQETLTTEC